MKVHILDDYFDTLRTLPSFSKLEGHEVTVWTDRTADTAALAQRISAAEALVLIRERTQVTEDLVSRLPNLRLVSQRGSYPHVDLKALTRHGILLSSNMHKDAPSVAAAELTLALIFTAARQIPEQIESARAGGWQVGVGRTLKGRTLGLYGYGGIARQVAGYARALGMEVLWWASEEGRSHAAADGETVAESREAFFARPDFVSLHQRLTPDTRGTVTTEDLAAMRFDAVLVNTARAGLIAPGALTEALSAGRPGRAALDVFDGEPVRDPADPVISHPRVIPTPHIGFVTEDEFERQFSDIYDQINAYGAGEPINVINSEVLDR